MTKKKNDTIEVKGITISVLHSQESDFISLTDIAKTKENDSRAADVIKNWIRNRTTIEFIGTWEQLYNPNFKVVEFDHFKMNAGLAQSERLIKLNQIAIHQMQVLLENDVSIKKLGR
ncbi:KilA-N domain-containing protein [Psychroflexus planctonicus]|uniref:KilA/APSES-type HTH DNA-binding domain-containing protein n=1 Tax=Psychroflexus planctonicus TaxID=1526575 RepID=A0ABQ1SGU6_9FLAO|nr:KilA-N domain-containing protein [Psychroflexus planctonicus]GGE29433.1 hypothetical protein GCM10010832_07450 [Psychroflexus planctonicus]